MPTSVLRKQAQPGGQKRSALAVNDGPDGRHERQASGQGHPRADGWLALRKARASSPTFLGAEPCEAEVRTLPLVLIGGFLPPAGS